MEFLGNLHSKVIHFPIAILVLYSFTEIIGILIKNIFLQRGAHLLLAIGVLTAVAAVLTGNQAAELAKTNSGLLDVKTLVEQHETYATITLWYFFALLVLRTYLVLKKHFLGLVKFIFIPLVLVGCYFIYQTGEHGGELVYKYGIGTEVIKNKLLTPINEIEQND